MVALGLAKFYGSSLPRPRFYTDVKYNDERVDPPLSVTDPLMAWAEEAHWSMGGLNSKRNRFQGRIEGNIERLRAHRDQIPKKSRFHHHDSAKAPTPSPQPVAKKKKRRRVVGLVDEEEEEVKKVRKLGGDFKKTKKKNEKSVGVDDEVKIKKRRKLGDDFEKTKKKKKKSVGVDDEVKNKKRRKLGDDFEKTKKKNEKSVGVDDDKVKIKKRGKLVKGGRKIGAAVVSAAAGIKSSPRN